MGEQNVGYTQLVPRWNVGDKVKVLSLTGHESLLRDELQGGIEKALMIGTLGKESRYWMFSKTGARAFSQKLGTRCWIDDFGQGSFTKNRLDYEGVRFIGGQNPLHTLTVSRTVAAKKNWEFDLIIMKPITLDTTGVVLF